MALMICQLIFVVCLLCAKHHVGAIYAFVLRERNRERERKRGRDLKDMGHSPLTNKILCETKNLKAKENQRYAEILVLGYESLEERNCVGMGRRHPRTGST